MWQESGLELTTLFHNEKVVCVTVIILILVHGPAFIWKLSWPRSVLLSTRWVCSLLLSRIFQKGLVVIDNKQRRADRFNQLKTNNVKWAFSELITSWKTVVQNNNRHGPRYTARFTQEMKWLRQQFSFSSKSSLSPPLDVCYSEIGGYSMEDNFQTRWPSRSGIYIHDRSSTTV